MCGDTYLSLLPSGKFAICPAFFLYSRSCSGLYLKECGMSLPSVKLTRPLTY